MTVNLSSLARPVDFVPVLLHPDLATLEIGDTDRSKVGLSREDIKYV